MASTSPLDEEHPVSPTAPAPTTSGNPLTVAVQVLQVLGSLLRLALRSR